MTTIEHKELKGITVKNLVANHRQHRQHRRVGNDHIPAIKKRYPRHQAHPGNPKPRQRHPAKSPGKRSKPTATASRRDPKPTHQPQSN